LSDDEAVLYADIQSRWVSFKLYTLGAVIVLASLILFLWIVCALLGIVNGPRSLPGSALAAVILLVLGVGIAGYEHRRRHNHWHTLTDQSVYKKTGILSKQIQTIDRTKDNKGEFNQGILERYVMDTATVKVYSAATDEVEINLTWVEDPEALRDEISDKEGIE
jgi:membrane protein YdbS with pleckstrin-like domain